MSLSFKRKFLFLFAWALDKINNKKQRRMQKDFKKPLEGPQDHI